MGNIVFAVVPVYVSHTLSFPLLRIVTGNNTNNKSESDQEDNDDVNDNDWSYGAEKKGDLLVYPYFGILRIVCYKLNKCILNQSMEWLSSKFACITFTAKKRKSDKVLFFYNSFY